MNVGDSVAEFELPNQEGQPVSLGDLVADGPVALYFYVKAKTPG